MGWTCEESIADSCSQKTPDTETGASFLSTLQMLVARSNLLQDVDDIIPAILPMAFIVPNSMRTAAVFFEASTQDTKFRVLDVEVSGSHDPSLPKETKSICLKNDGHTHESAEISDVPPKKRRHADPPYIQTLCHVYIPEM